MRQNHAIPYARSIRWSWFRKPTFLEYLMVSALLGVGLAAVVPELLGRDDYTRPPRNKDFSQLEGAIVRFEEDCGRFPTESGGLSALITPPSSIAHWRGPYVLHLPKDRWGRS
jgi:general secretion pathway protein G